MKKVLLIEKDPYVRQMLQRFLTVTFGEDTLVLVADTPSKVEHLFVNYHDDLSLVLIDMSLGDEARSLDSARSCCKAFQKPIVAMSLVATNPYKVVPPGCTHVCEKAKSLDFFERLKELGV